MYPHFIEVHDIRKPEDAMLINIKAIKHIYFEPETNSGAISLVDKVFVPTKESYDELKDLITNAGCHIEKGDPRLDTSHPLMMKDIEEMKSGEPVWNSNRNEWYLLRTMTEDGEVWFSDFVGSKVIATEEMLIKTPLYRMKRDNDRMYIPDGYAQAKTGDKNHE